MDSSDKKKKQRPYSEYERQLLMQLVQSKIDIVENRRTDGITQKKKNEAWDEITSQFNNTDNVSQTASAAQLKKMWQNMKTKARDAKILDTQTKRTGGGPALPDVGSEETQVLSIIPAIMPSINLEIDSDIMQPGTSKLSQDDDDSLFWQQKRSRIKDFEVHVVGEEGENTESLQGMSTQVCPPKNISKQSSVKPNRKFSEATRESLDDLKKELLKKEIEKIEQQMKQEEEKHKIELQILEIKRDILKKELNNK